MKFNCDRCKTRYSISDERVRGKVLKIRCKNCSAVITVREGMTASAPRTPQAISPASSRTSPVAKKRARSESALHSAFDDAMSGSSVAEGISGPPASIATEWYLAIDGDQSGPFDLGGAKGWIREQAASAELYCWSEGFDDWLPVEKISQFRDVRSGPNGASRPGTMGGIGAPMPTFDTNVEKTPAPLFKATMDQVTAEAPTIVPGEDPIEAVGLDTQAAAARDQAPDSAFEFDIGEASRVVNLASLLPAAGAAAPVAKPAGLPGMGNQAGAPRAAKGPTISGATSPELELPRPEVLQPIVAKRSRILLPLLIASGALVLVLGVLLFLAFRGGGPEEEEIARGGGVGEDLAHQFDDRSPSKNKDGKETSKDVAATKGKRGTGRTKRNSGASKSVADTSAGGSGYKPPSDEVDLSRGGSDPAVRQGSLEPSDIFAVYRRSQFSVNRCYERSIKKNPLLKVGKTNITLKVGGNGRVARVAIPSLAGESLGSCLRIAIGRWRFPKSTEGFNGTFPIVFKQ